MKKPIHDGKKLPPRDELLRLFEYDNGNLIWRIGRCAGQVAGCKMNDRAEYRVVIIGSERYFLHRLIWAYHYGDIPSGVVMDHINNDSGDNRLENLQLATVQENSRKKKMRSDNRTGRKGVTRHASGKYQVLAKINGKLTHLGMFVDLDEAARQYDRTVIEHFGDFAFTNFPREEYENAA